MRLKTLLLVMMVWLGACTDDESHFLNCGEGVHLEEDSRSYCMYSASIVASQGEAFACPDGTLNRIDIDGAAVCTNVPGVDTVSELPAEVCEILQVEGCLVATGLQFNVTLSSPGSWESDATRYGAVLNWVVTEPSDIFIYGTGAFQHGELGVALRVKLPEEALNQGVFGIGFVVVMDPIYPISEGNIDETEEEVVSANVRGWAPNHVIIFRQNPADYSEHAKEFIDEFPEKVNAHWFNQFQDGYSCGRCVPKEGEMDGFEPVACEEIVIESVQDPNNVAGCDWE